MAVTYVAMHPEIFGNIQFFKNDVGENIKLVEKAVLGETEMELSISVDRDIIG